MNFNRLAPCYRALEFLAAGNQLQRCRTAFLDSIPAPRRVLIAGEGNGRFLGEITRRFPDADITVVDSSRTMLDLAKSRVSKSGAAASQIDFVHADLRDWTPTENGHFDLIVTHFFLDCFSPDRLANIVARLSELAAPTATWLLADFQSNEALTECPGPIARLRRRVILAILYRFFRTTCQLEARFLTPPDNLLAAAGFQLQHRQTHAHHLLHTDLWIRDNSCDGRHENCRTL